MSMDRNIRVKTDRKYKTLYRQLTNLVVGESHELFFVCACIGFQQSRREPLGKRGDDRFWSGTITPEEWACFYAMHLSTQQLDFRSIQNDEEVIRAIEEYANAGTAILLKELLCDYATATDDDVSLDIVRCVELPKVFLNYVFEAGMK